MSKPLSLQPASKRKVSLTVRVSALLVLAVVVPLIITVLSSEFILRPTLLTQAANDMESDAQTHAQAVDSYLVARLQELGSVGQYLAIQKLLTGDTTYRNQASNELVVGNQLVPDYNAWTIFDAKGNVRLSYPLPPKPHGKYMIVPGALQQLNGVNKSLISDVYFNNASRAAYIDIYSSITDGRGQFLGFVRATLDLNTVWTQVDDETNAGPGNYAMVVDGHGVRIAYTNTDATKTTLPVGLFKAITPMPLQFQQLIKDEDLYGNSISPVTVKADPTLANMQQNTQGSASFQMVPALQSQQFQVSRATSRIVPWTYLVLRPVSTITKAADQQELYLFLIATLVTVLAAVAGLAVGQGITRPILRSVSSLLESSQSLKTLAASEQSTATEQRWIVDSSKVGLESVEYYSDAASVAARRLDEITEGLQRTWERNNTQQNLKYLQEIVTTAKYLDKAISGQKKSSIGLASAIRVTAQITDQLVSGATSASEASAQLDAVVEQLREVAGK
jgi:methyl-accepting chemotaxis protein